MKIIPAIDLIDGKTVRLKQGEYNRKLSYDIDPASAAGKWASMGAEMIHVVDLDGAKEGRPVNLPTVRRIMEKVNIPVEVGGGFRTLENIEEAIDMGISRVIVGSRAFKDMDFARRCIEKFGEKVILSGDAKDFQPQVEGWEEGLELDLLEILKKFVSYGAREIIYTDIKKDGMLTGPSTGHIEKILAEVNVHVISAGGVKTVEDVIKLKELEPKGLSGVIIGRALYEGTIDLREAIDAGKADNTMS